jgi:hypothetical protein
MQRSISADGASASVNSLPHTSRSSSMPEVSLIRLAATVTVPSRSSSGITRCRTSSRTGKLVRNSRVGLAFSRSTYGTSNTFARKRNSASSLTPSAESTASSSERPSAINSRTRCAPAALSSPSSTILETTLST